MGCMESAPLVVSLPAEDVDAPEKEEVVDDVEEAAKLLDPSHSLGSRMEVYK